MLTVRLILPEPAIRDDEFDYLFEEPVVEDATAMSFRKDVDATVVEEWMKSIGDVALQEVLEAGTIYWRDQAMECL
jgi:hypothetical protein